MQTLTLNNGVQMPALGLGVFQTPPEETRAAVTAALDLGYRWTAAGYRREDHWRRWVKPLQIRAMCVSGQDSTAGAAGRAAGYKPEEKCRRWVKPLAAIAE